MIVHICKKCHCLMTRTHENDFSMVTYTCIICKDVKKMLENGRLEGE